MGKKNGRKYIGLDVGGTNITAAMILKSGEIISRAKQKTPRDCDASEVIAEIASTIKKLIQSDDGKSSDIAGIGIGIPGVVDPKSGIVTAAPNIALKGAHLGDELKDKFDAPVILGNDVNVGTIGECWLGAGREADSVVGIFIGTGIGGGIVQNRYLVTGSHNAAGEIGHIVMETNGPICGCGNKGCLEAIASRTAIEKEIRAAIASGRTSILADKLDDGVLKSKALLKALSGKDALVTEIIEKASETIGYACLTVRHLLDPDMIILGGGVIEACGDFVLSIVQRIVKDDKLLVGMESDLRVVRSTLGDDAGVLGAAAMAMAQEKGMKIDPVFPKYPKLKDVDLGEIKIGGNSVTEDVYIRGDGKIKERKKALSKKEHGTSHVIGIAEIRKACKGGTGLLVVGAGRDGAAKLSPESLKYLQREGIRYKISPTPEAIKEYNRATGVKAALIHLTC